MIIITLGTFDIGHYGHLKLLKKCKGISERFQYNPMRPNAVIVGLNTDDFIKRYKNKPPIMSYKERETFLYETGFVDGIIPNDQTDGTAKKAILISNAKMIVIGSDWGRKPYLKQLGIDWDWLDSKGIALTYVTYTKGVSTTEIKKRCNKQ
ncbi:MAG: adenylyltransferase/cytidyltransferase family protein [Nanoarchaeota archaeon]|nr:adenylyltransferase/cytidyltransferase family protein [Nanoarchaeota archaeon]